MEKAREFAAVSGATMKTVRTTKADLKILRRLSSDSKSHLNEIAFLAFSHTSDLDDSIRRLTGAVSRVQAYGNAPKEKFNDPRDQDSLFFGALRETAEAFSSISRIFFPSNPKKIKHIINPETVDEFKTRKNLSRLRGQILRELFEIENDSPIANTLLRNRLVHMDEDVDLNHLRKSKQGDVTLRRITAPERDKVEGIPDDATFERFDPETNLYIVLGHRFDLNEIVEITQRLGDQLSEIVPVLARAIPIEAKT